jgi:prepilin-type N-terminal cleavage/methylation domain-containing protein
MRNRGFSVLELVVAIAISTVILLSVLSAYSLGSSVKSHVQGTVKIQNNVRLGMDRLARELRMTGYSVPRGFEFGSSASWSPSIFHATPTQIGIRADIDGGKAEIVCTPATANVSCPLTKLRLDTIDYYQAVNCKNLDGSTGGTKLIAVVEERWKPFTCSGYSASDGSLSVSGVPDAEFEAGISNVATVEQIYYRYVPSTQAPYGRIERTVRYGNTPDDAFPPSGETWTPIASQLTDFWLQYQDASGSVLTGSSLTAGQRSLVRKVVLFMEGYDKVGPDGHPQLIQVRSEVLVRNLAL